MAAILAAVGVLWGEEAAEAVACSADTYAARATRDLKFDGLANFGVVEAGVLYRGCQPFTKGKTSASGKRGNGFDTLKSLGIKCRILLRESTKTMEHLDEKIELANRGIQLFHLPVPSPSWSHMAPGAAVPASYTAAITRARDKFMEIVSNKQNHPCYVSCLHGKDRTGALVGWYRAVVNKWKPKRIFAEQKVCKYNPAGPLIYYRRVFCEWYRAKFGSDPDCDKVLGL
ncbi:MAG: tyrosine-protein phosphatase [Deltaproteobacteria bacterium]|nr:tyrosine-protein phosphatase [Deltaproteobacteria bacterium]